MIKRRINNISNRLIDMFYWGKKKPASFLIIGAQKAGTSTLFDYLCKHPQLVRSYGKEIGFFNRTILYEKGYDWYNNQFMPTFNNRTLLYEATPEYLYYPNVAKRIHKYSPNIKLIITLREPVSRAYSSWNMFRQKVENINHRKKLINVNAALADQKNKEVFLEMTKLNPFPDFEFFVEKELNYNNFYDFSHGYDFIRRGIYVNQIEAYLKYFDSSQILIIEMSELKKNIMNVFRKIELFLEIDTFKRWNELKIEPSHKRTYNKQINSNLQKKLSAFYNPHNEKLFKLINKKFMW